MTKKKSRQAMAAVLADPRWKALASGRATAEEVADLRAWADQNKYAAEAWGGCQPATQEQSIKLAEELLLRMHGSKTIAELDEVCLEIQIPANLVIPLAINERAPVPGPFPSDGPDLPINSEKTPAHRKKPFLKQHSRFTNKTIQRAIDGDRQAVHRLLAIIELKINADVKRLMLDSGFLSQADVQDLCQETVLALFANGGQRMKSWDPKREAFGTFVGRIVNQMVTPYLRRQRVLLDHQYDTQRESTPEELVSFKQEFDKIARLMNAELSELGRELFRLLFIDAIDVIEICKILQLDESVVQLWRRRLANRMEQIARTLRK